MDSLKRYLKYPIDWVFEIPAILTFTLGVINIISAVGRPLPGRVMLLRSVFSVDVLVFSRGFVLVVGLLLLILAYQLTQRSRTAWVVAVSLISVSIVGHLVKGFDFEEALFALVVLAVLFFTRGEYQVRHRLQNFRTSFLNLLVVVGAVFIFGILGFFFLDRRYFGENFLLLDAIHHWSRIFFGFGDPTLEARTRFARMFVGIISLSGIFTVIYAFFSLFRPAYYYSQERPEELARVEEIIQKYGHDSLDYFKKYHGKTFFIAEKVQGFLAYRQIRRFAIVLSDPVARNKAAAERVLEEFIEFCRENGWQAAFVQTEGKYLEIYEKHDFNRIMMGEEACLPLDQFTLEGPEGKEARYYLNRFEKEGFKFTCEDEVSTGLYQKLKQVNEEWLTIPHYVERTFTEGYFEHENLAHEEVFTVTDAGGAVICFASVVEYPERGLALLDLMRRKAEVPNGAMDFLIYKLELYYKEKGYKYFDLSLAPLSGIPKDATMPEKTLKFVYNNINQLYSFSGLRKFKEKFNPNWQPRYLVYQSNIALPFLIYSITRATAVGKLKRD